MKNVLLHSHFNRELALNAHVSLLINLHIIFLRTRTRQLPRKYTRIDTRDVPIRGREVSDKRVSCRKLVMQQGLQRALVSLTKFQLLIHSFI